MKTAHRKAHRQIWACLAVLLPAILLSALIMRPSIPLDTAPVLLEPAEVRSTP